MIQNAEFDRCVDFLARMIEKYGGELGLTKEAKKEAKQTVSAAQENPPETGDLAA